MANEGAGCRCLGFGVAAVMVMASLSACGDSEDGQAGPAGGSGGASGSGGAGNAGSSGTGGTGGTSSGGTGGMLVDGGPDLPDGSAGATTNQLIGKIRDFRDSHPDFEYVIGDDRGLVEVDLGQDRKPVYAGGAGTLTTNGQEPFDQWFRDVAGVNDTLEFSITLSPSGGNVFSYDNQEFFPIDDQLFGNEGREHNFHFTYEINTSFLYVGGEVFKFTGDDDLFVFINDRLAIDLGGVHGAQSAEVDLDAMAGTLQIETGKTYALDFFFAERHTSQSTFRIDTTIGTFVPPVR